MKRQDRRLEMQSLLAKYNKSEQTVRAFCEERGVKESVFYYWQRQFRMAEAEDVGLDTGFMELQIVASSLQLELTFASGLCVGLSGLSQEELAALLYQLDRQHSQSSC